MNAQHLITSGLLALGVALLSPAASAQYQIQLTPGSLASELSGIPAGETALTLSGTADASDLLTLREWAGEVKTLDLSALSIAECTLTEGEWLGHKHFAADDFPAYIFTGTGYTEIKLPASLKTIGDGAFSGAQIQSLSLPDNLVSVGDYAFRSSAISSISGGRALTTIGKGAFSACRQLASADLSDTKISALPEHTFAGCSSLKTLSLPSTATAIAPEALSGTAIAALEAPSVNTLDDYSLSGMTELKQASTGDAKAGTGVYLGDVSLTSATGISGTLPAYTFAGCTSLDVSNAIGGFSALGEGALASTACSELMLAPGLSSIGSYTFAAMSGLEKINAIALEADIPAVEADSFGGLEPSTIILVVADNQEDAWKAHPVWGLFDVRSESNVGIVTEVAADTDTIRFGLDGNVLTAVATEPIDELTLYSFDGRLLNMLRPGATTACVALDSIADKAIIVAARSGRHTSTIKLMLK